LTLRFRLPPFPGSNPAELVSAGALRIFPHILPKPTKPKRTDVLSPSGAFGFYNLF
jgi:hypothetical protein